MLLTDSQHLLRVIITLGLGARVFSAANVRGGLRREVRAEDVHSHVFSEQPRLMRRVGMQSVSMDAPEAADREFNATTVNTQLNSTTNASNTTGGNNSGYPNDHEVHANTDWSKEVQIHHNLSQRMREGDPSKDALQPIAERGGGPERPYDLLCPDTLAPSLTDGEICPGDMNCNNAVRRTDAAQDWKLRSHVSMCCCSQSIVNPVAPGCWYCTCTDLGKTCQAPQKQPFDQLGFPGQKTPVQAADDAMNSANSTQGAQAAAQAAGDAAANSIAGGHYHNDWTDQHNTTVLTNTNQTENSSAAANTTSNGSTTTNTTANATSNGSTADNTTTNTNSNGGTTTNTNTNATSNGTTADNTTTNTNSNGGTTTNTNTNATSNGTTADNTNTNTNSNGTTADNTTTNTNSTGGTTTNTNTNTTSNGSTTDNSTTNTTPNATGGTL